MNKQAKRILANLKLLARREREKAIEARDLARRTACHAQIASRAVTEFKRLMR